MPCDPSCDGYGPELQILRRPAGSVQAVRSLSNRGASTGCAWIGEILNATGLDVQVYGAGPELAFDLKLKNYDDLRATPVHVPAILVVVCVPADIGTWLDETPEHTAMRRCAYWLSLRGLPATGNTTTCRVRIPRTQAFTVATVRSMMTRIGEGGLP